MILLKEINIDDILILNRLIFKFKLPLFKSQSIYWCEGNYISFEFTIYVKPHNCANPDMHQLNKFSINPRIEYIPTVIQKIDNNVNSEIEKELLFDYIVCDLHTFSEHFYFLNKSHVDYLINIKAYLLNFDQILIYWNECKNHVKFIRETFNTYDYAATFYLDDEYNKKRKYDQVEQDKIHTNEEINIEPLKKKIYLEV